MANAAMIHESIPTGLRPKAQGWNASFLPWVADHINSSNPNGVVSGDSIGLSPRHIFRPIQCRIREPSLSIFRGENEMQIRGRE
jgi:hypothetical protein